MENTVTGFLLKVAHSAENHELIKLIISSPRDKGSDLKSIIVTLAQLKRGYRMNFVYRHTTRDITKNYEFSEGIAKLGQALTETFNNANLFSASGDITLVTTPAGKVRVSSHPPTMKLSAGFRHDKVKQRLIDPVGNIYLRELGITNANWEIRREMSDKYKQINRYIEMLEPELRELPALPDLHVADMGSGKGYLTFALYDFLKNNLATEPVMKGVEYREDLVAECNRIAGAAGFSKLEFVSGTIEKADLPQIDILIALHACDTATDDAIFRGIIAGASLIVCAPCCHKQVRKDMKTGGELAPLVKYGILLERQAEIITDTIRAMILEAFGYKTKVMEFISTEHTPKNVMITGRRISKENPDKEKIFREIASIRKEFGISSHYLEGLLLKSGFPK